MFVEHNHAYQGSVCNFEADIAGVGVWLAPHEASVQAATGGGRQGKQLSCLRYRVVAVLDQTNTIRRRRSCSSRLLALSAL